MQLILTIDPNCGSLVLHESTLIDNALVCITPESNWIGSLVDTFQIILLGNILVHWYDRSLLEDQLGGSTSKLLHGVLGFE